MTNTLTEQKAIEKGFDDLHDRVNQVCRDAVEAVCKRTGWDFSSAYDTKFTSVGTKDEHDFYDGNRGEYRVEHEWPADFKAVFDWAETQSGFTDMMYEDGRWTA